MKEKRLNFKGLWMCLVVLLISLLLQVVAGVVGVLPTSIMLGFEIAQQGITDMEVINQMSAEATANAMGFCVALAHVMIIITFGLWYGLGIRKKIQTNPISKVLTPKNIGVTLLMAVSICFFVNFGMEVAVHIIPASVVANYVEMMETAGFGESILTTIAAVCLAPIGEELVYRGTCMYFAEKFVEKFDKTKAFWIANVIQALGFGIFHMNIIQGTYAFLMGLCLGYLAKRYKSVVPAMIAHMVINACSSFLWAPVYNVMPQSTLAFGVCALACMAVTALSFKIGGNPLVEQED